MTPINANQCRATSRPRPDSAAYHLPPPATFGGLFPEKFNEWRPDQSFAILSTIDGSSRFIAQAAPTGFGKSLVYLGASLLSGLRTCILTSTKGLQEQILSDFNDAGDGERRVTDIRGQNAYRCRKAVEFGYPEYTTCDYGPCHSGRKCPLKDGGCAYYDAYREACSARIVTTNYAYWLSINKYGQGLGEFDMLVLDEAHDAPDILADFMSVEIEPVELASLGVQGKMMDPGASIRQWKDWANYLLPITNARVEFLTNRLRAEFHEQSSREMMTLKRVVSKLAVVAMSEDDWIVEKVDKRPGYAMKFDPLWPYKFAEKLLFLGIPKIMLVSATLREKTCELLGIDSPTTNPDLAFYEYDSTFPVSRRPVIHVPTVQMNHRTDEEGIRQWLTRIDQILAPRQDRKGIIHTVSFARAKRIVSSSEYSDRMFLNESRTTRWTVENYKSAPAPAVLVSPSVTTGYDFPYDQCEYQIIGKLPFPDNRAAVIKARMAKDKEFTSYYTMQVLIQECGRGMRAYDDQCETIIIDDSILWFMKYNAKFAPNWFRRAVQYHKTIPAPPPPLKLTR